MSGFSFGAALVLAALPASAALPTTSSPELQLVRTIRTNPFSNNASISVEDPEGSDFIDSDEYWLVADRGSKRAFRLRTNGTLVSSIARSTFSNAPRSGGGPVAGSVRSGDFESMAFAGDLLYIFSGKCCNASVIPAVFRMNRNGGGIVYKDLPLPKRTFAAASTRSSSIYVAEEGTNSIRTYNFGTNVLGPVLPVSGLIGNIQGMDFSSNGADLIIVTSAERLFRVNPVNRTVLSGWNLNLAPFGIGDARTVAIVPNPAGGFDQLYVSDGSETRPVGDPLRYAVYVFNVLP